MFPVQSSCSRMLRMTRCKHLLNQTLEFKKTISASHAFHSGKDFNRNIHHNFICSYNKEHSPPLHTVFINKISPPCMYSTSTTSPDEVHTDSKPSSRSPVMIRRDRLESQAQFRSILSEKGDQPLTDEVWSEIEQTFTEKLKERWEVFCMHTLYLDMNVTAGKSLVGYLTSKNIDLNPIALTFFIGLLGKTANGNVEQENEMMKYFNILKSKLEVFDAATIEVLVSGLCKTSHYLECVPFLDIYKEFNTLGPPIVCNMLEAGLRYKNMDFINLSVTEFNSGDIDVSTITFQIPELIETCFSSGNIEGFEKLMNLLHTHRLLLPKTGLDNIVEVFNRYQPGQWATRFGSIHHKSGVCRVCRTKMNEIEVSDTDFSAIQKAFLQQVIIGKNVFYKSTPAEVKTFLQFVKARGPFDVVIDGLNVLYKGQQQLSKVRLHVVLSHFLNQNKKVLLLGNNMLSRYLPSRSMPGLHVFQSDTTKADDVFYLYAALYSGSECLIVTSDKLRDHKFLLQKDLRPAFHKWLQRVQLHHWMITDNNELIILRRDLFDVGPVKDPGGWHFPVNDVDKKAPFGNLGVLCMRHKRADQSNHETSLEKESVRRVVSHNITREKLPASSQEQSSGTQPNSTRVKQKQPNLNARKPDKKNNLKWYEM